MPVEDLPELDRRDIEVVFKGGEEEADLAELALARASRVLGAIDLALAEGLLEMERGGQ